MNKTFINKDMIIEEAIELYPEITAVLIGYELHCIGCYVSAFESLEEGLMRHGYDDHEINIIIAKLNAVIQERQKKIQAVKKRRRKK